MSGRIYPLPRCHGHRGAALLISLLVEQMAEEEAYERECQRRGGGRG